MTLYRLAQHVGDILDRLWPPVTDPRNRDHSAYLAAVEEESEVHEPGTSFDAMVQAYWEAHKDSAVSAIADARPGSIPPIPQKPRPGTQTRRATLPGRRSTMTPPWQIATFPRRLPWGLQTPPVRYGSLPLPSMPTVRITMSRLIHGTAHVASGSISRATGGITSAKQSPMHWQRSRAAGTRPNGCPPIHNRNGV